MRLETMPIGELLAKNKIAEHVREKCCYAHPELLEKVYGN